MPSVLERIGESLRAAYHVLGPSSTVKSLRDPALSAFLSSGSPATDTLPTITEGSALAIPSVWAAVQCIAGDVASLPFFHYRRRPDGGKERASSTKLYKVLHDEFNPEMSAMVGRETLTSHVLLWGNAYAEIQRNDLGQVVALWPIEPTRVMPERAPGGGIVYRVAKGDGTEVVVPAERILHVVGLGFNGLMGYPVITLMRQALGVGAAADQLGGQVMARGAKYSGFFEHPRTLGATAHKNLKESLATDPPGGYRILEEGMTYKAGSMPLKDAEFMAIRRYSVTEVARIFGIPPHKIGDLERATFSNVEEQNLDYVITTLRRWLVRWEQECNRKLIAPLEKTQQFTEHLVDGLLRGNIQSRYSAYSQGIMNGYLSPNDIRTFENLDPIAGGDTYLVQGAMIPLAGLNEYARAEKIDALGGLIRAGFDPAESLEAVGLGPITHLGIPPVTVQPEDGPAPPFGGPRPDDTDDEAAPPAEPDDARVRKLVADLRAESRATMLGAVAARLVRQELAQLRKRAADPTAAAMRLLKFYRRWVADGAAELRRWHPAPAAVLTAWADQTGQACVEALQRGTFAAVVAQWDGDGDRAQALLRALQEASDG